MTRDLSKQWMKWLSLAELWHNTTSHSSIKTSPFKSLYGYTPPLQLSYFPRESRITVVDQLLPERESINQLRKKCLLKA